MAVDQEHYDELFGGLVDSWQEETDPARRRKLEKFMARLAYHGPEGINSHEKEDGEGE